MPVSYIQNQFVHNRLYVKQFVEKKIIKIAFYFTLTLGEEELREVLTTIAAIAALESSYSAHPQEVRLQPRRRGRRQCL